MGRLVRHAGREVHHVGRLVRQVGCLVHVVGRLGQQVGRLGVLASSTDMKGKRRAQTKEALVGLNEQLVRSNQRQLPRNQQLRLLFGRRGSLEKTIFHDSELREVLKELLVQEVKQPFFEGQALYLEAKTVYLETRTFVFETGRTQLESRRPCLEKNAV